MKLKTLLAVLAFVGGTVPSASALATTNSLTFQGVTFEIMSSGNLLTLNIYDALSGGTGNWTNVQYLSAFEFHDYGGSITSAQVTSTNTGVTWTNSDGGVNSSGTGCGGGGSSFDCFVASSPASLTDVMTWTIQFFGTSLNWEAPSFKVSFLENLTDTKPTGDHLSRTIPPVSAIPEPEIYAMMGIGLGVLGWLRRKKKFREGALA
jgi:hypothetical protein